MKIIFLKFLIVHNILVFSLFLSAEPKEATLNCKKARNIVDLSICRNASLKNSHDELLSNYNSAQNSCNGNSACLASLKSSQSDWTKNRQLCFEYSAHGQEMSCLEKQYSNRISYLISVQQGLKDPVKDQGQIHPFDCEYFSSWKTHWAKGYESAGRFYTLIWKNDDACWATLGESENQSRYMRNLIQLAYQAGGSDCKVVAKRYDPIALKASIPNALEIEYLEIRTECLPRDRDLETKLNTKLSALKKETEENYQNLVAKIENDGWKSKLKSDHSEWLKSLTGPKSIFEKLEKTSFTLSGWRDDNKMIDSLPKCATRGGFCKIFEIGKDKKKTQIEVRFLPVDSSGFSIKEIRNLDLNSVMKIPENLEFDLLGDGPGIKVTDCNGNGNVDLIIGHSTARFPYWDKLPFDSKTGKFSDQWESCSQADELY